VNTRTPPFCLSFFLLMPPFLPVRNFSPVVESCYYGQGTSFLGLFPSTKTLFLIMKILPFLSALPVISRPSRDLDSFFHPSLPFVAPPLFIVHIIKYSFSRTSRHFNFVNIPSYVLCLYFQKTWNDVFPFSPLSGSSSFHSPRNICRPRSSPP